jgi:glycoside/pentoside/hexuronide:cation symporter, GPH family
VGWGIGELAPTAKGIVFGSFLLFYFTAVVGMEPFHVGLALGIALMFDAVSDPLVGSISDNWHSRWGRRHPLMVMSLLPLCVSMYFLFNFPQGLSAPLQFGWLLVSTILVRTFLTFFQVPYTALGAEMSNDYAERSRIFSYRTLFGWFCGVGFTIYAYNVLFATTDEYPNGLLNPAAYPNLALTAILLICVGVIVCVGTTYKVGARLPPPVHKTSFTLARTFRELLSALQSFNFKVLLAAILIQGAVGGTVGSMGLHMQTYFWGLVPAQIQFFAIAGGLSVIVVFALIQVVASKFDKRDLVIFLGLFSVVDGLVMISLKLMDLLPDNSSWMYLPLIVTTWTMGQIANQISGIMHSSMIADVVDENELTTGTRQEGVFFSALSFSGKAVSALGTMIGGAILSFVDFPVGATVEEVPADIIFNMGIINGPILHLFFFIPLIIYTRYNLSRVQHLKVREALERKSMQSAPT